MNTTNKVNNVNLANKVIPIGQVTEKNKKHSALIVLALALVQEVKDEDIAVKLIEAITEYDLAYEYGRQWYQEPNIYKKDKVLHTLIEFANGVYS